MYLIGRKVYFNHTTGKLYDLTQELTLGENAKECLSLLLENTGLLVSKEEIVKRVWTSKGVVVSDNAVRQTMHILRRSLSRFSPDKQLITTIPRNGYMITEAYVVDESDDVLLKISQNSANVFKRTSVRIAQTMRISWPGKKGFLFSIFTAALACVIYAKWHDVNYHTAAMPIDEDARFIYRDDSLAKEQTSTGQTETTLYEAVDESPSSSTQ